MKKNIIIIQCIALLLISMSMVLAQPDTYIDDVRQERWYDDLFSNFLFSTSSDIRTPGTIQEHYGGEYIGELPFRFYCSDSGSANRFQFAYFDSSGAQVSSGITDTYTLNQGCDAQTGYKAKVYDIRVPKLSSSVCGEVLQLRVRHQRLTNNQWVTDTYGSDSIGGFEKMIRVQYLCDVSPCDGLTGDRVGDTFCRDNDVAILEYSDIVKDGQCFQRTEIIQNCRGDYSCVDGSCEQTVTQITGYLLVNNQCSQTNYLSNQQKPSGFYSTYEECQSYLQTDDDIADDIEDDSGLIVCSQQINKVCGMDGLTYSNECFMESQGVELDYTGECQIPGDDDTEDNTEQNQTDDSGNNNDDEIIDPWYIQLWDWIVSLFR